MSRRVVLGCYEVPGYGGAATASYRLFQKMQEGGVDVSYVNIISEEDAGYLQYRFGEAIGNPRHLEAVYSCVLDEPLFLPHPALDRLITELDPDVILADDFIAALLMKRAAPERYLIFMTAGLSQVSEYLARRRSRRRFTLDEFLRKARGGLRVFHGHERAAFEVSDLIVTHAQMIKDLAAALFPLQAGKIYSRVIWRAEWIVEDARPYLPLAKPFQNRDIDVVFVASSWQRPEKNYPLLRRIATQARDLTIHMVGESVTDPPGVLSHGLVTDREELFALLGRSKVLVSPSHFDAAPGILWEASVMGCNVVTSRNCGNWMLCHDELLADPATVRVYLEKTRRALQKKYNDNLQFFLTAGCYDDLVDTVMTEVLA